MARRPCHAGCGLRSGCASWRPPWLLDRAGRLLRWRRNMAVSTAEGSFLRDLGVDRMLRQLFGDLESRPLGTCPMQAQLRLLIDAVALGEHRVFGVKRPCRAPAVCHAGRRCAAERRYAVSRPRPLRRGSVAQAHRPDGRARPGACALASSTPGGPSRHRHDRHPWFGAEMQRAVAGPNPRYPILARTAETDTWFNAALRTRRHILRQRR